MRVLIVTDTFPPRCGGSGWSTFHLARALTARGHAVRVVKPEANLAGVGRRELEGIPVADFGYALHDVPYVRSFERDLWLARRLERFLAAELAAWPADVVHAQHALSTAPAVAAAARLGLPSIATVRDHWTVCYFTTAHVEGGFCPDCGFAKMLACMKGKSPSAYWAGIPLMPYMRRIVRRKQRALAAADAVIAVSEYIAARAVRGIVGGARTHVIANPIDAAEVARVAATPPALELPERFVLFVGKLRRSKGAWLALEASAGIGARGAVLLMVGDGPDRGGLESAARDLPVRFLPWVENRDVWRIMRRAAVILVPSLWPESLSRTVTEAMAVGAPVLATDCGGIHDQIRNRESGAVLPADPAAFAAEIDRVLGEPALGRSWAEHARQTIAARFDDAVVLPRIEALYVQAIDGRRGRPKRRAGGEG
jgi:glycosyltransferase involved in cell wall biosynthesis